MFDHATGTKLPIAEDADEVSDVEEAEEANDEKFAALVARGRYFIEGSNAYKKLRRDFRRFVIPASQQVFQNQPTETYAEVPLQNIHRTPRNQLHKIHRILLELLSGIGLVNEPIPPSHKRISWTNVSVFIDTSKIIWIILIFG